MELHAEVVIEAPAAAAWAVLGERFGDIGVWATPITASSLVGAPRVGAVRTCHVAGFGPVKPGVVEERLIAFDPADHALTYEAAAGLPRFVARARNRWSVHALGDHCVVRTHATLTVRGAMRLLAPLLAWRMRAGGRRVLEELKHQVEHGRPHARKLAAAARALSVR